MSDPPVTDADRVARCRNCGFTALITERCWYLCPWKMHDLSCPECSTTNVQGNSILCGERDWDD